MTRIPSSTTARVSDANQKYRKRAWTEIKALEHYQRCIVRTRRQLARATVQLLTQQPGVLSSELALEVVAALADTADIVGAVLQ
ncbi:hypothetical protein MMC32_007992 [Xylographa parallela]|nr:hypothetical protein [Xylographa parallela]